LEIETEFFGGIKPTRMADTDYAGLDNFST
jgi:hypothetical protein